MRNVPVVPDHSDRNQPRVGIVVLNWRQPQDTIDCVLSLLALDYADADIIVCDNDSGDRSVETIADALRAALPAANAQRAARGWQGFDLASFGSAAAAEAAFDAQAGARRLWIVQTGRNGGYAFGNNVGLRLAMHDPATAFGWVLNNDTIASEGALRALVACAGADPSIGICGATVLYLEQPGTIQALGGGHFLPRRGRAMQIGGGAFDPAAIDRRAIEAQLSYVNGAVALVSRALIEQVGYMDEGYFLYWEEMDWATRARATGRFRLGYCPEAIVYHRVGATTGSNDHGVPTLGSTYWMTRSQFRFLRLHRPATLLIAAPLLVKRVLGEVLHGRARRGLTMIRGALGLPVRP